MNIRNYILILVIGMLLISTSGLVVGQVLNPGIITVTGYITSGPECDFLAGDNGKNYDLIGTSIPPVGTHVSVTGIIRNDMASICMNGIILQVLSLTIIDTPTPTPTPKATLTTDKKTYKLGGTVVFTITNTGTEQYSVEVPVCPSYSILSSSKTYTVGPNPDTVCAMSIMEVVLNPGQTYSWTWDQKVVLNNKQAQIPWGMNYKAVAYSLASNDFSIFPY